MIDTQLALSKSVGPFSAGTRVVELAGLNFQPEPGHTYVGARRFKQVKRDGNIKLVQVIDELHVPIKCLVELRPRTDNVPAIPRKDRPDRVARRTLYNMTHPQRNN